MSDENQSDGNDGASNGTSTSSAQKVSEALAQLKSNAGPSTAELATELAQLREANFALTTMDLGCSKNEMVALRVLYEHDKSAFAQQVASIRLKDERPRAKGSTPYTGLLAPSAVPSADRMASNPAGLSRDDIEVIKGRGRGALKNHVEKWASKNLDGGRGGLFPAPDFPAKNPGGKKR